MTFKLFIMFHIGFEEKPKALGISLTKEKKQQLVLENVYTSLFFARLLSDSFWVLDAAALHQRM